MKKKKKTGDITLLDFKLHYKAIIKQYHIDQWNNIESPEISQCISSQLTYKETKNTQWGKDSLPGGTGQLRAQE